MKSLQRSRMTELMPSLSVSFLEPVPWSNKRINGFYTLYKEKQMVHWLQYFAKNRLMQSCYVVAWHPIRVVVHSGPTQEMKGGEGVDFSNVLLDTGVCGFTLLGG